MRRRGDGCGVAYLYRLTVVSLTEVLTWCEPGLMTTICGCPNCPGLIVQR
jgi:hypothetical protein